MPFYSHDDVLRVLRQIHEAPCEVSEELRGWRWNEPPLTPSHEVLTNVSDISFECKTGRIAYLRNCLRLKEKASERLRFGAYVHNIISAATAQAKAILYNIRPKSGVQFFEEMMKLSNTIVSGTPSPEYLNAFRAIWHRAALTYSSSLDRVLEISQHISLDGLVNMVVPWICEYPLDGRRLGLNRAIRIDALVPPNLLIEFKTRPAKRSIEVALAGYALCFECQFRTPINYAVILYLDFNKSYDSFKVYERIVRIDDFLRLEFIERRDLYAERSSADVDPGVPDECDPYCPYLGVCRSDG
ncbi:MAG: type I-A CRISPR-associated protein Cas4/Csa1 [Thaumarchaeota archaeon]|jgi:CRISPR-associated protein Csa1|nr:type I-A CRISPR-associated protein Cas4/Csa1 [Candidatus Terraquivivens yellowstonensis]MCL7388267.1 type I-A CRISPR-associated protein Cas4/Csa1 [Candidatus Terraquivivens yellowstonensis]MCL7395794.1 type I-A CRISPR-associated protein Cas4/Csa1 [Candidatus Terraquivivens yellowstonensis]MCL7401147.1 type I-A CRISPR-associated protein Cas4/Csa1 [Candidatus Terraquivivens yellowstonensis]